MNTAILKCSAFGALCFAGCFLSAGNNILAQNLSDGLRFSDVNSSISARAAALGEAYSGIADDAAALYFNPAGLSLIQKTELTGGLQYTRNDQLSTFLPAFSKDQAKFHVTSVLPSSISGVFPFLFGKKRAAISFGYIQRKDFTSSDTVGGFNANSSLVNFWTQGYTPSNFMNSPAWKIFLADTVSGKFTTPIRDSVMQSAFTQETGSLQQFSIGLGSELSSSVAIGASVNWTFGSYNYVRTYREDDILNKYNFLDKVNFTNVDFSSLSVNETISQSISGFNAVIGVQGRAGSFLRYGFTVTTPGIYNIKEDWSQKQTATFDNKDQETNSANGYQEYTVTTPFVFGAALSTHFAGLTVAGSISYSDLTQLKFSSTLPEVNNLSSEAARRLTGRHSFGLGAEYELPELPLVVRAGYSFQRSPYIGSTEEERKIFSIGAGIYAAPNVRIDLAWRSVTSNYTRLLYGNVVYSTESTSLQPSAQIVYRF